MNHHPSQALKKEPTLDSKKDLARDIHMAGPWITEHEEKIVLDALRNGWYGRQAYTYCEKFEAEFAKYHGRAYALMTPNCTSALHLLLAGLGIGEGDEVITSPLSAAYTALAIMMAGATPVFADVEEASFNLDPKSVASLVAVARKRGLVGAGLGKAAHP